MEQQLQAIENKLNRLLMLMEVQMNGEKLHRVAGYSWGRTSDAKAFIILYPAASGLKHKICRVYEEDFGQLPPCINTAAIPETAQESNPDREQAIKKKIYRPTPAFIIATREGKETQMGPEIRFSRVIEAPAGGVVTKPTSQAAPAVTTKDPAAPPDIFDYKYGDGTEATPEARPHFDAYRRANSEKAPASRAALGKWCKDEKRI